ncbi:helix-turn-helix domain-containing protein [Blastococcus tunisiensis]|uniref:AraC-type DNA-binding protein n=1 Tax=Blastococcus tunisiensis TaxID=1798228 RepID=A0A1I1ZDQ2_9ACTN|nr:helix-turn-helix domain-containing protein [Blastococcus sp. DSM 46838]SFE29458.1 AraC-type DNA-binding protein [Blastococcus sp. DSM 46838]
MSLHAVLGTPVGATAFDSRRVAPPVQVGLWEKATARFLVPMRITARDASILGVIAGREVAGASFCRLTATPHVATRDARLADGAGAGHYKIAVGLRGRSVVSQHGRRVGLGPGDVTVYDTSEPYSVSGDVPFGLLVVRIRQDVLDAGRDRVAAVAATALTGDRLSPVRNDLLALAAGNPGPPVLDEVMAAVDHLIRQALPVRLTGPRNTDVILAAAKELIAARLDDPGLTPGFVAAALGVSRRYLYALFAAEVGPVAHYVRTVRLERARDLLIRSAADELSVADVAVECGYPDAAHFSRLFRRAYGRSPRTFRRESRLADAAPSAGAPRTVRSGPGDDT